ncbi:hypothetical protein KP803_13715 [Vibrio sp. ZSDE26]|uniref:Uncharacterized protein n=1 Tax=Vibrio amylolyticus TaxID=2847292 RepID=A0A9X1XM35_9VIBR|nr:hypothetical protein [Vibrio amylolyticus]MCK6264333.1 hypothetical protein [Vibrio amylolyticus]
MSKIYCNCCRKPTHHKVVMKRCQPEKQESVLQNVQTLFSSLFQGDHYVKMEKQGFCRDCNSRSELTETNFSNVRVI